VPTRCKPRYTRTRKFCALICLEEEALGVALEALQVALEVVTKAEEEEAVAAAAAAAAAAEEEEEEEEEEELQLQKL